MYRITPGNIDSIPDNGRVAGATETVSEPPVAPVWRCSLSSRFWRYDIRSGPKPEAFRDKYTYRHRLLINAGQATADRLEIFVGQFVSKTRNRAGKKRHYC